MAQLPAGTKVGMQCRTCTDFRQANGESVAGLLGTLRSHRKSWQRPTSFGKWAFCYFESRWRWPSPTAPRTGPRLTSARRRVSQL
jgi:hypothetical protein